MNLPTERRNRLQEILETVRNLPPRERLSFLDDLKDSNPKLAAEVKTVIEAELETSAIGNQNFRTSTHIGKDDQIGEPTQDLNVDSLASSPSTSTPVFGKYQVLEKLGEGGMGVVFKARDHHTGRELAMKTMKLTGGRALELFKSEFRYLQGVSHPNLVQLYGLEVDECGRWLLTMEYVEGTDLKKHLGIANPKEQIGAIPTIATSTTNDSLCSGDELKSEETHARHPAVTDSHSHIETPPSRRIPVASRVPASNQAHIRETFAQLAQGIAALHVHRRIHRDLKPQNVLVEKSGRVVILDFGLTAALDNTDEYMASALAGTASYMAPEQAASTPVASPASDWYAFGVMLYESLAGGLPFTETRFHQLQQQKLAGVSTRPSQTNSGVDLELEQLCLGLLAPEPTMRPGVDDIMGVFGIDTSGQKSAGQLLSSPLFGRESHLQMLRSAWFNMAKGVEGGIASVVRLHGPSGMGKSTLVSHFLEELRTQQILVLSGKCYEHESVPFKALDPVVDALAGYLDSLADNDIASLIPAECSPLLRVFPVLDRVRAIQQTASAENRFFDPQELRQKAFSGLRELLNRLANRKPIVIHIDDLQWGDADSWLLLSDLLRSPSGPGILWLLAHRSEDTDSTGVETLTKLLEETGVDAVEIAVGPLTQAESLKLFRFIHGKRLDPIVEQLASDAGGHPFFLTELARANQAEILNGAKFSLDGLIGIRVAGLTPDSRRLLELVAVSGRPLRDLDAYAAMGGDDPRRHVAHLESVRLLRGVGGAGRLQWETYHDRVRDTVIAGLDDETRIQHHAKLAKVLKESRSAEPEQLAIHFEESLEPTKAGSYYLQAGDQATRSVAFEQASQFYSKALELLESSEVQKLNIREKLADALANAGRSSEAGPIYLAAAEEQKGVQQLELQRRAMDVTLHAGRNQEGMRLLAGLFETLGESLPDGREKAMEWMMSEYGQLMERGPDFIEKPEASVSPEVLWKLDLLYAAGWRMYTCDAILGSYYFCRAARLALDIGETYRASRALASAATIFCWGGDTQARNIGRDWFRKAEEVARREPNEYWLAYLAMKKGFLYWGDGNWQKATEECQKAENHASRSENSFAAFQMDMQKIAIHARMMMGHWRDGLRRTSMFLDLAKRQENMYHQCSMLMTHSLQSLVKDQPDEAERLVLQGRKMWLQVKGIHPGHQKVCSLIDVYLYTDRGLDAEKLIRAELAEMKQVTSYEFIEVWLLTVSHTHGRALIAGAGQLAVSGRQTTRRSQLIEEAQGVAELIEDRRMAWADPLAKLLRAGIANLVGDSTTAEELLTKAESEFRTAGMLMYAAASQFHRGRITRAKVGEELIQSAETFMVGEGIVNSNAIANMLVPGFTGGKRKESRKR